MNINSTSPLRVASYTLGCKLNQAETESLVAFFKKEGFESVSFSEEADIVIVNTCTVTSKSEQKGRRSIRNYAKHFPNIPLIVTGCYAQLEPEAVQSLASNIIVVSSVDKARIAGLPKALILAEKEGVDLRAAALEYFSGGFRDSGIEFSPFIYAPSRLSTRSRAFLKIQDGCDFHCSFCRVSPARGDSISLSSELVLEKLRAIVNEGYREVVLTGVNLCCYKSENVGWESLVEKIGDDSQLKDLRIRLSSLSAEYLTPKNIESLKRECVAPHFHISIQAGSDNVLKLMRRRHTFQMVIDGVARLRAIKNDPFIAADIIVGFPGESETDFEKTLELIEIIKPAHLHVFPYSERPGTEAYDFGNKVAQRVTKERIARLDKIAKKYQIEYLRRWEGRSLELLVEEHKEEFAATSENYIQGPIEKGSPSEKSLVGGQLRKGILKLKGDNPCFLIK